MSFKELVEYVLIGDEIEFSYKGRMYSITYYYPNDDINNCFISFCEFYKETTEVRTPYELWNNVSRDGVTVGEMLSSISKDDIYIY
ncbi:MAG: hypothetical protein II749_05910 [Clostridia bacterium]|nr:hypothetical protein [Clostridia bacterium]